MDEERDSSELFDHFLPLLDKYFPIDEVGPYLIQARLLTRSEYLALKKDDGRGLFRKKSASRAIKMVEMVVAKGPGSFTRFFETIRTCLIDTNYEHTGLEHICQEMEKYLKEQTLGSDQLKKRPTSYKSQDSGFDDLSVCSTVPPETVKVDHLVDNYLTGIAKETKNMMHQFFNEALQEMNQSLEASRRKEKDLIDRNNELEKDCSLLTEKVCSLEKQLSSSMLSLVRVEREYDEIKQRLLGLESHQLEQDSEVKRCLSRMESRGSDFDGSYDGEYYSHFSRCPSHLSMDGYGIEDVSISVEHTRLPHAHVQLGMCTRTPHKKNCLGLGRSLSLKEKKSVIPKSLEKKKLYNSLPGLFKRCTGQTEEVKTAKTKLMTFLHGPIFMVSTV